MIDLSKVLFVVDGRTEITSMRDKLSKEYGTICEFRKVVCNGIFVPPTAYANSASGILITALAQRYENIIFIVDKEKRRIRSENFSKQIKKELIKIVLNRSHYKRTELEKKINVFVPNIMFENWIVSDVKGIKKFQELIHHGTKQEYFDGKSGSSILKSIIKVKYKKTIHGPKLFKSVDFNRSKNNSPSFYNFYNFLID